MEAGEIKGLIFDIQGHSVHDGPGTRTVVFMSGCPLRCKWCANAEGQLLRPRLMYKAQFCRECPLRCVAGCPKGAVRPSKDGSPPVLFDRSVCDCCDSMDCTRVCYRQALQLSGKWYTVEELMRIFNRDRCYWGPEGGITFSGGEPLVQQDFLLKLLEHCKQAYISACVETNAYVPRSALQSVLPFVQWLFIDIKHMDSAKHAEGAGVPNETVLDNIRWLTSSGWPGRIIIRVPIIVGYNDTAENAQATADFLAEAGVHEINLLPFHRLGAAKYEQLGLAYDCAELTAPPLATLESWAQLYRKQGIACYVGSDTPF
jgi:glycyl-radical enzyme activating protein